MTPALRVITLAIIFSLAWGITKRLQTYDQFCTWKSMEIGDSLNGTFVVSGFTEEKFAALAFSPTSKILYKADGIREGTIEFIAEEVGEHRVCFRATDKEEKYVSFDINVLTANDIDGFRAVTSKNIDDMSNEMKDVEFMFKRILRNQYYQNTRDGVHFQNLQGLQSSIQWSTVLKVLSLIAIAGGQGYLLTAFVNKKNSVRV